MELPPCAVRQLCVVVPIVEIVRAGSFRPMRDVIVKSDRTPGTRISSTFCPPLIIAGSHGQVLIYARNFMKVRMPWRCLHLCTLPAPFGKRFFHIRILLAVEQTFILADPYLTWLRCCIAFGTRVIAFDKRWWNFYWKNLRLPLQRYRFFKGLSKWKRNYIHIKNVLILHYELFTNWDCHFNEILWLIWNFNNFFSESTWIIYRNFLIFSINISLWFCLKLKNIKIYSLINRKFIGRLMAFVKKTVLQIDHYYFTDTLCIHVLHRFSMFLILLSRLHFNNRIHHSRWKKKNLRTRRRKKITH